MYPGDPRAKVLAVTPMGRERASKAIIAVEAADADSKQLLDMFRRLLASVGRGVAKRLPVRGGDER